MIQEGEGGGKEPPGPQDQPSPNGSDHHQSPVSSELMVELDSSPQNEGE